MPYTPPARKNNTPRLRKAVMFSRAVLGFLGVATFVVCILWAFYRIGEAVVKNGWLGVAVLATLTVLIILALLDVD